MSSRVLVFGGNGFLGKRVVDSLLAMEMQVKLFTRNYFKNPNDRVNCEVILFDCLKSYNFDKSQIQKNDYIVYLAQPHEYNDFPKNAREIFQINTGFLFDLIEHCSKTGVKKFIYASSGGVYKPSEETHDLLKEDVILIPRKEAGFYLGTKLLSEYLLQYFNDVLPYTILRYFFIYGPGQRSQMLFPRLLRNVKEGVPIYLQGEDGFCFNPVYVDDAANLTIDCLFKNTPKLMNIAGTEMVSLKMAVDLIGDILGKQPVYSYSHEQRPAHYHADISLMLDNLTPPLIGFNEGIERTVHEFQQNY